MKNTKIFPMLLLSLLAVSVPVLANPIGLVVSLEGDASAERSGQIVSLAVNSEILLADRIVTKGKSKVQIKFADESVMSLGENSDVVMDEYVYDASKAEDNAFGASLGNGIFRVISGKIVEMNPDRFKVKTSRSTIGIRGCDLGFVNNDSGTQVLIFFIPVGHEILIGNKSFTVPGRFITINNQGQLDDQPLDEDNKKKFEESTGTDEKSKDKGNNSNGGEKKNDEEESTEDESSENPSGNENAQENVMTEGELMEVLVNTMGLSTMLPPNPSEEQMKLILMQNGIFPEGGWEADRLVTLGTLARIIVQSMGQANAIENPEDDASWVNFLAAMGLDLTTIQTALQQFGPSSSETGFSDAQQAFDPTRRYPFAQPFTSASIIVQIFNEIFSTPDPDLVTPF